MFRVPRLDFCEMSILRKEPLRRPGRKPHIVEEVVRRAGELVYVRGGRVLGLSEFYDLVPSGERRYWRQLTKFERLARQRGAPYFHTQVTGINRRLDTTMLAKHTITQLHNTFVISDLHLNHGHAAILKDRSVTDAQSHIEHIVKVWNQTCDRQSVVYHLGDFAMKDETGSRTRSILHRLHFKELVLLWGNHNSGLLPLYREAVAQTLYELGYAVSPYPPQNQPVAGEFYPASLTIDGGRTLTFVGNLLFLVIKTKRLSVGATLCHYAMRNWHHNGKGAWMLCGHSHGNDAHIRAETAGGRCLDCSWESLQRPWSLEEVAEWMERQPVVANDHH